MMDDTTKVTLKVIAAKAGVTPTTVSLALRNHPRISVATRERIQLLAQELGYAPDPLMARLMTQLQSRRKQHFREVLALVTAYVNPRTREEIFLRHLFAGMRERGSRAGFEVQEVDIRQEGLSGSRLSEVLLARGIHGAIIAPFREGVRHLPINYHALATTAASLRLVRPAIDCVIPDHYRNMMIKMRKLKRLGYRRIVFLSDHERNSRNEFRWQAAYLSALTAW